MRHRTRPPTLAVAPALILTMALAACASKPPAPDWEANAKGSLDRYVAAWMDGADRAATAEFTRARSALAATGEPGRVARAELTRCALQVAALDFRDCTGFDVLRADAPEAERAYADYLAGRLQPGEAPRLPEQHRAVATGGAGALPGIADPLGRLVAAGVLLRTNRASPGVLATAAETATAQGWRRPLLAWLGLQAQRADAAGQAAEAERIRRRIALAAGER